MVFVVFALKKLCVPELGHQEAFQKHKPAFGLTINQKDLKHLSGFISVVVNNCLSWITTEVPEPETTGHKGSAVRRARDLAEGSTHSLHSVQATIAYLGSGSSSG